MQFAEIQIQWLWTFFHYADYTTHRNYLFLGKSFLLPSGNSDVGVSEIYFVGCIDGKEIGDSTGDDSMDF